MEWIPLYVALAIWLVVMIAADRAANQRALDARQTIEEANELGREYLKQMKENSRLLEELNALLRVQT